MSENNRQLPVPTTYPKPGFGRLVIGRGADFDAVEQEIVQRLLMRHFRMSSAEALQVRMAVDVAGRAFCGTYTFDVAETKALNFNWDLPPGMRVRFGWQKLDGPL